MGVPFVKYTSYGNNFVIVDECFQPTLTEAERQSFAYLATNLNFGIGSDNFLVIQYCTEKLFAEINAHHHYWEEMPDPNLATYVFRMFEPDGTEAYSCGNGLMCIANYLHSRYGIESTRIMTQIPTPSPKVVTIGTASGTGTSWANMGEPCRVPRSMAAPNIRTPFGEHIDFIEKIEINNFRESDGIQFFKGSDSVSVNGYLVYTGEPHFVILTETGISIPHMSEIIFPGSPSGGPGSPSPGKRRSTSTAFVDFFGTYFSRVYGDLFPSGININFLRYVEETNVLEYRCFERGINRETLACGTGALACAFVAERLNLLGDRRITVWPHRCRWHIADAEVQIQRKEGGWVLHGRPYELCEGTFSGKAFSMETSVPQTCYASNFESLSADHSLDLVN